MWIWPTATRYDHQGLYFDMGWIGSKWLKLGAVLSDFMGMLGLAKSRCHSRTVREGSPSGSARFPRNAGPQWCWFYPRMLLKTFVQKIYADLGQDGLRCFSFIFGMWTTENEGTQNHCLMVKMMNSRVISHKLNQWYLCDVFVDFDLGARYGSKFKAWSFQEATIAVFEHHPEILRQKWTIPLRNRWKIPYTKLSNLDDSGEGRPSEGVAGISNGTPPVPRWKIVVLSVEHVISSAKTTWCIKPPCEYKKTNI